MCNRHGVKTPMRSAAFAFGNVYCNTGAFVRGGLHRKPMARPLTKVIDQMQAQSMAIAGIAFGIGIGGLSQLILGHANAIIDHPQQDMVVAVLRCDQQLAWLCVFQ